MKKQSKQKQESPKEKTINHVLLGLIIALLAIIVFSSIFYSVRAAQGCKPNKKQLRLLKNTQDLKKQITFIGLRGINTYFSLTGKNDKGQEIAVIIPKSGEKVKVLAQKDGITEQEAKEKIAQAHPEVQIEKASLGMYDNLKSCLGSCWKKFKGSIQLLFAFFFESGKEIKLSLEYNL